MLNLPSRYEGPEILPLRERARVVNDLLRKRFETLLPAVMRETGFDMWLIICHEDNHDPVFRTMIPWQCWAPILQIFVFYDPSINLGHRTGTEDDRPKREVERLNVSRTNMMGLMSDIWHVNEPENQWEWLRRIVVERNPKRIGINESDVIWAADGLTVSLKRKLVEALGPELSTRLESAEPLCIRWLETRIPEEIELYHHACSIGHAVIKECLSRRTITPGVTTTEDLRWAYWQLTTDLGLPVSFPAFFNRIRSDENKARWGEEDTAIRQGDLVHCDVGVEYLRLLTDHQEMAYILRPGETDAPKGLKDALAEANRLQDIFISSWQKGLTGNEILKTALDRTHKAGIPKPKIYSHSLGHYLHEPGPLMGLPWEQVCCPGRGDVVMNFNTVYTVELNVTAFVPEWNQEVRIPIEQDAVFTESGVFFLDGRQTVFHLV